MAPFIVPPSVCKALILAGVIAPSAKIPPVLTKLARTSAFDIYNFFSYYSA
jgi:hypothetical protein